MVATPEIAQPATAPEEPTPEAEQEASTSAPPTPLTPITPSRSGESSDFVKVVVRVRPLIQVGAEP